MRGETSCDMVYISLVIFTNRHSSTCPLRSGARSSRAVQDAHTRDTQTRARPLLETAAPPTRYALDTGPPRSSAHSSRLFHSRFIHRRSRHDQCTSSARRIATRRHHSGCRASRLDLRSARSLSWLSSLLLPKPTASHNPGLSPSPPHPSRRNETAFKHVYAPAAPRRIKNPHTRNKDMLSRARGLRGGNKVLWCCLRGRERVVPPPRGASASSSPAHPRPRRPPLRRVELRFARVSRGDGRMG